MNKQKEKVKCRLKVQKWIAFWFFRVTFVCHRSQTSHDISYKAFFPRKNIWMENKQLTGLCVCEDAAGSLCLNCMDFINCYSLLTTSNKKIRRGFRAAAGRHYLPRNNPTSIERNLNNSLNFSSWDRLQQHPMDSTGSEGGCRKPVNMPD